MRRVQFAAYGGPEVLAVAEVPEPEPGPGELLVQVGYAGVTLPVVRLTRGDGAGGGMPLPAAPGADVVGRVLAVGPGVTGWTVGQRAAGLAFTGGYAERAVVSPMAVAPVPDGVPDEAALLLVRSGQVAFGALAASGFTAGESVLITAAAGGVGHLAVQLAAALGASRVVAAIGAGEDFAGKADFVRAQGATEVVGYPDESWGEPVDVVLDGAGGPLVTPALAALAPGGRLVAYHGVPGGVVDPNDELRQFSKSVIGFTVPFLARNRPAVYAEHQRRLWELAAARSLRPAVHAVLPLAEAGTAHALIEGRANHGKILLDPRR